MTMDSLLLRLTPHHHKNLNSMGGMYRVAHLVVHLGWVDLEFESSTVLPNCPAAPAKFPPAQAESGRQWNTQISSQPNPGARPDEPPCRVDFLRANGSFICGFYCKATRHPLHLVPLPFVFSYRFGSLLAVAAAVPLLRRRRRPLEEERLGGAGLVPAQPESAVEALDVGEDALPVGLLHPHHVLHVEQGAHVAVLPEVATISNQ